MRVYTHVRAHYAQAHRTHNAAHGNQKGEAPCERSEPVFGVAKSEVYIWVLGVRRQVSRTKSGLETCRVNFQGGGRAASSTAFSPERSEGCINISEVRMSEAKIRAKPVKILASLFLLHTFLLSGRTGSPATLLILP